MTADSVRSASLVAILGMLTHGAAALLASQWIASHQVGSSGGRYRQNQGGREGCRCSQGVGKSGYGSDGVH